MKLKKTIRIIVTLSGILMFSAVEFYSQPLKPTEIIYSRTVTNMNAPPTGANQPTIWAVGQDGSNDRFITNGTMPRISDDGRFLLFKRFTRHPSFFNPFGGYADFFVRDLASGQETLIVSINFDQGSWGHYFSPESNQGNFEIIADDSCLMYKFNRNGSNITFLYPTSVPAYCADDFPVVKRGGDQLIAFHNLSTDTANGGGLFTVGINGSGRQKIPNTNCGDMNPAWSNDSQFIGYGTLFIPCGSFPQTAYPYFVNNLWKIRTDGSGKQQLTNFSAGDCSLASTNCLTFGMVWSEDNSKLITAGRINGTSGLYAFSTDGNAAFSQIPISPGNAPDFVGGIVQPRVEQNVVSVGGGLTSGGNYSLVSTIGEVVAGQTSSGGQYTFESGFWALPMARNRTMFDFDGDGMSDISVFRPSTGAWYLLQSQAGFSGTLFGTPTDRMAPADFDGDGRTDIAVYRPSTGYWYVLNSSNGTVSYNLFGVAEDLPTPGDFDGDGRADLSVFRPSNGTWYRTNSSNGGFVANQFGANGDKPTIGDFDGDGKTDIAVYRPSNGGWYRLNSSTGAFVGQFFGVSTDVITPADFDGDGKTDLAVYRPSAGTWYIIDSSTAAFRYVVFGLAADIPAAGDFDGDGKADVSVFRPTDGTWYRLNSSTGAFVATQFGANGDRPTQSAFAN